MGNRNMVTMQTNVINVMGSKKEKKKENEKTKTNWAPHISGDIPVGK